MELSKSIKNNKKLFVKTYDAYFMLIIFLIVALIFLGFENPFLNSNIFVYPVVGFIILCSLANIFFMYYYNEKRKMNNWGVWAFISIVVGILPYALIFVPLHYFIKLRPYWKGKKEKIY